jgi:hypothetical protein
MGGQMSSALLLLLKEDVALMLEIVLCWCQQLGLVVLVRLEVVAVVVTVAIAVLFDLLCHRISIVFYQ